MSGYEVVIEQIRKASGAAGSAAEQAARVDLAAAVSGHDSDFIGPAAPGGLVAALPGSSSAEKAPAVCARWQHDLDQWAAEANRYARSLTAAADLYATNEQAAEDNLLRTESRPNVKAE